MSFIDLYQEFETELTQATHYACDVECTQLGPEGAPDAYYRDNKLLLLGYSFINNKYSSSNNYAYEYYTLQPNSFLAYNTKGVIWGHNVKFDRAYLIKHFNSVEGSTVEPRKDVRLFIDIGIATYLHSGHRIISPTLDQVAEYWGVSERKLDTLHKGIKTQDIPIKDLDQYLKQDLKITRLVAETILATCNKANLYLYWLYTKASTLIGDIEQNGLYVDLPKLRSFETLLEDEQKTLLEQMAEAYYAVAPQGYTEACYSYFDNQPETIKYICDNVLLTGTNVVRYMCYSDVELVYTLPANIRRALKYTAPKEFKQLSDDGLQKTDKCPVDADVIQKAIDHLNNHYSFFNSDKIKYLKAYQQYVKNRKLLTTYVKSIIKACEDSESWRVRSKYNTCVTATSRLSSSSPNAQNIPQVIRQYITAPAGKVIVTGDFKQIEICALAFETQDFELLDDLFNNVDIHARAGKDWIPDRPLTEEERRQVKGVVFGTIYGGTPKGLAEQTKLPVSAITLIQKALFKYYKTAFDAQLKRVVDVNNNAKISKKVIYDADGRLCKYGFYVSQTGHAYSFRQYYSNIYPNNDPSVSSTEVKDRPIQGTAAEWKMMYLALLDNIFATSDTELAVSYRKEELRLVADVHDELVWECPKDLSHQLTALLELLASDALPYVIQSMVKAYRPNVRVIVPPIVMSTKINTTWTK
jgi:DNA polymerase I-like protein with 3'-5' exonuclease and polymerase domains